MTLRGKNNTVHKNATVLGSNLDEESDFVDTLGVNETCFHMMS